MANPKSWEHHRGKKHSPEWVENQRTGVTEAWADPQKFQTMRKQSAALVAKRFAKHGGSASAWAKAFAKDPKRIANLSKALRGRKLSDEHRKIAVAQLIPIDKLSPDAEARRRKSISDQRKGCHNYGRAARDNPKHFNAKHWVIRSPEGIIYEFDNLQMWCRANESLFLPDDKPDAKLPLWHRAVSGFNGMIRRDRKAQHAWKGWTLVSSIEMHAQGAPDLLERGIS